MNRVLFFLIMISFVDAFFNVNRFINYKPLIKTSLCSQFSNPMFNETCGNNSLLLPKPILKPIQSVDFDHLFLVFFSSEKLYMSSNADRIIICYDNKKVVYYINNEKERKKIEYLLSLIDLDVEIVNDYPTKMDTPSGSLYCSPKKYNITDNDIENILYTVIYEDEESEKSDSSD